MKRKNSYSTISSLLMADSIKAVLCDFNDRADSLASIVVVTRDKSGNIDMQYYGSMPETVGLLDLGKQSMSQEVFKEVDTDG